MSVAVHAPGAFLRGIIKPEISSPVYDKADLDYNTAIILTINNRQSTSAAN